MGMFDNLRCEYPLPDGFSDTEFQTKSFERLIQEYVLTKDGRLLLDGQDQVYDGVCQFYTLDGDTSEWHEYRAIFESGLLKELRVASPEERGLDGAPAAPPSQPATPASAQARKPDRPTPGRGKQASAASAIAEACLDLGLTAQQVGALSAALFDIVPDPGSEEWLDASRLLSMRDFSADDTPEWIAPVKLGASEALQILRQLLPTTRTLLEQDDHRFLDHVAEELEGDAPNLDFAMDMLMLVKVMPQPHEADFHLVGSILHALASAGSRRGMFSLAYHLRVYAAHPVCGPKQVRYLESSAQQWESLAFRVRLYQPDWQTPYTLLPAADRWHEADRRVRNLGGDVARILQDVEYASPGIVDTHLLPEDVAIRGTAVLLDRIGGMPKQDDGSDSWKKVKGWQVLLRPMPVVGTFDPDEVYSTLRREYPWMEEANVRAAEMVAGLRADRPRLNPILLTGGTGIGKTSWARRLADLCKLPHSVVSAATGSAMLIAGSEREWKDSAPCIAAKVARETQCANPLLVLDEVDKSPEGTAHGTIIDALLPLLDPANARRYYDLFLEGHLDLSRINWVLTCNDFANLASALMDRVILIKVRRPTFPEIEQSFDAMSSSWLGGEILDLETRRLALAKYAETRSLRELRRFVERSSLQKLWQPPGLTLVGQPRDQTDAPATSR